MDIESYAAVVETVHSQFHKQLRADSQLSFVSGIPLVDHDDEPFLLTRAMDPLTGTITDVIYDPGTGNKGRFVAAFTTRNMLWNIQRSNTANHDNLQLSVDTSYRYNLQGWGLLVIATIDRTGSGHRVAYALIAMEDTASIQFTLHAVKIAFEELVEWLHKTGRTTF
jgi:hypothetical protein